MADFFKKVVKNSWFWVVIVLLVANVAIFWQFYLKHLLPFPGDLLVSFFFPWNSGGFIGFDQWTTHKDVIAADVIRQIYPWKNLVIDQIKHGQLPFWNPYNFSGTPLLANLQSSVFFPGNIFLLVLPFLWGWIFLVIGLPFFYSVFFYLFLRSLKLSVTASLFGAIISSNISYFLVWSEQLVIIQSALFLPLALWSINKQRYFLVSVFLALSIFGGHIQTSVYVFVIVIVYACFRKVSKKLILLLVLLSLGFASIQLVPSIELYFHSAREGLITKQLFTGGILPFANLITAFAPDFFGNPATGNFWGRDYGNFQVYFGVAALVYSLMAIIGRTYELEVKFFLKLGLVGLTFAMWPLANLLSLLSIPILSSGVAARSIFIFQVSFAILAAYGFDTVKGKIKPILFVGVFVFGLMLGYLWLFNSTQFQIGVRNLILPIVLFVISILSLVTPKYRALIFLAVIFEYSYFFNKFQPFSFEKFVFPNHPVTNFLKTNSLDRYYGVGTAYIDNNFATYFHAFSLEGYDSLYIKRYGQLLGSAVEGKLLSVVARSDAIVTTNDNQYRKKLFDILGVKYILDKNDEPKSNWEAETWKFPEDQFSLFWQKYKWKAYLRKSVMPRAFLTESYVVANNDSKIIESIYSKSAQTVVLETEPIFAPQAGGENKLNIEEYLPNKVAISVNIEKPKLLFLSDAYYPGWEVLVDGQLSKILRADFALRAVALSAGNHKVIMSYNPLSFKIGLIACSLTVFLGLWLKKLRRI